ncbi:LuxR C-terminal-related transcriptional regulator [Panacagrimonas perspica]|uniref:LuxR C-terminal-related transcriptional regulator n=1 Tax=Panacagrimonas perspica TaxID=381431 RepID=UPI0013C362B5|nr:LuxR C-terminal-related transcriptional regulator [Panacagrimonas perspica]
MKSAANATSLPQGLIATKLVPAAMDRRLVSRESLFGSRTGWGGMSPVVSIVAAAGSGKSTLMAQLHHDMVEQGVSTCWLSLDADDNTPAVFAVYFLSALSSVDPNLAREDLSTLRSNPVRDFDVFFDALVARLSAIDRPTTVFIDDFQHIGHPRVLRFLNRLLAHLPPCLHLVFASRVQLPLDLARLRVAGALIEVDQDHLNFDATQAGVFLKRYHDVELAPDDLQALITTTEGWPTGIQLAALAIRRHRGSAGELIKSFSGRDKDLTRYLVETVLSSQSEIVRQFLLTTAPLRRMSPDLCRATSGHADSGEMLEHLERCNLFVIALDRNGQWYRYHHLFAEFLQNELRRTAPEAYRDVCERAADWCQDKDLTTEAIQYALDGECYEKATDLIARHSPKLAQFDGDHYTVLDWMRRLPTQFHDHRPESLLAHAWSRAFSRGTGIAMQLTEQVLEGLKAEPGTNWDLDDARRQGLRVTAHVVQAVTHAAADEMESCFARAGELRASLPPSEDFLIGTICNCLSLCHFAKGDFELSAKVAVDAYFHGQRAGAVFPTLWADFLQVMANVELGRLHTAHEVAQRAYASARSEGSRHSYGVGLSSLINAEIAIQRCNFDSAREFLGDGSIFKEVFGPAEPVLAAIRNEARAQAWNQELGAACRVLEQGQHTALGTQHPRLYAALAIEEATLQLIAGDTAGASQTASRTRLLDDSDSTRTSFSRRPLRGALQLLAARFQLAQQNPDAAARILTQLLQARGAPTQGCFFLTVTAVRAVALWNADRRNDAARELDRALRAAAPEFHVYPIASAGRALLPVLDAIAQRRTDAVSCADLDKKLLLQRSLHSILRGESSAQPAAETRPARRSDMVESMTVRETELLRLVDAGLANRQLADALLVSEATVKWHLHNIYEKMGVRSRSAAAARAREMQLF